MTDTTQARALAPAEQRQVHRVENTEPMLDSNRFEHFQRAASALMHSTILNPSIRGSSPQQCFSNLMLVFDLSDRWKLPALSIAQCISIVHDKVVYEGKLITAMLQSTLGVTLHFHYTGQRGTDGYRVYVSDRDFADLSDDDLAKLAPDVYPRGWRMIDGSVADWKTLVKDKSTATPAWTGAATRNQLAYRGSREWTRLYEPAKLLGVYGDDEIDSINVRMERARDVTPPGGITSGLTAGFRSAAGAEIIDGATGEVMERTSGVSTEAQQDADHSSDAAKKVTEPAQDVQDAKVEAKAATEAKPAEEAPAGKKPTAKQLKAAAEKEAAELARVEGILEDAFQAGVDGRPLTMLAPGKDATADEVKLYQAARTRHAQGVVEGEEAAQAGDDNSDFDGDDDDDAFPGDAALAAIREAEPEIVDQVVADHAQAEPTDAIKAWIQGLPNQSSWAEIKASMNALSRTDAWEVATKASPDRIADVRRRAWLREAELIEAGDDRMDFINDLTAFRCWIETTTDEDAIQGNWQTLVRQEIYKALPAEQQGGMQRAVLARVETIQRGKGSR